MTGGSPPHDRRQPDTKYLNQDLIYACDFFISLAIVVGVALLVFNLSTIWKPWVRAAAPAAVELIGHEIQMDTSTVCCILTQAYIIASKTPYVFVGYL